MLVDFSMSLQNGYENRGLIMPYLHKYNFYDCCIKVGNDLSSQKVIINGSLRQLDVIPVMIVKYVPCLIGVDSIIDIDIFKKEILLLKPYFDLDVLLFVSSNSCIKYRGDKFFISEMDASRILNIFGFMPNIIDFNIFLYKYSHPFFDCAGGFYNKDGGVFNRFREQDLSNSSEALAKINPRIVGNIIGIFNIFEVYKGFSSENSEELYNYISKNYNSTCQIFYNDYLLSYKWLNLDKINTAIKTTGANIICCFGLHKIKYINNFILIIDGEEKNIIMLILN